MRFQVLGPLRVAQGDGWLLIQAGQQRVLLAVLLAEAGRTVSAQRLIHEIWSDNPPRGALRTLQGYVFRLRALIGGGRDGTLVTRDGGYELQPAADDIDAQHFERLVATARRQAGNGAMALASDTYAEALGLWRGPALADVPPSPTVSGEASRLDLIRLQVIEERFDVLLTLGKHGQVAIEVEQLTSLHPLRETLWEQCMLALSRSGRRGEALAAYQRARRVLVTELGVEPGARLQELHRQILDDRASVPTAAKPDRVIPAQLPADVAAFTGREVELKQLDALADNESPTPTAIAISTINGTAGIGKTALAVRWAHRNRERFPDGQLFVNLRGFAEGRPMQPGEALARFLRALGVPQDVIPADVDEATALYRSHLASKRLLVVLDNAKDAAQVRQLLPGSAGCRVLITSRHQLMGIIVRDGVVPLSLDLLSPGDSLRLLTRVLGPERVQAEGTAAAELADLCGHLPLALRIAAAHLAVRPALAVEEYVTTLRADRLGALEIPDEPESGIRVAFDQSFAALSAPARRLFSQLGVVPGSDFDVNAVGALADVPAGQAAALLGELARAHLAGEAIPGRYALHDLLREYAAGKAAGHDESDRHEWRRRLFGFYTDRTGAAAEAFYPHLARLPGQPDALESQAFRDDGEASDWLDAERANLVATVHAAAETGHFEAAWRIADNMRGYLYLRMYLSDWAGVAGTALKAARAAADPAGQAAALISLAAMHWAQGHGQKAIDHLLPALDLTAQANWPEGEATALGNLGAAYGNMGYLAKDAEYALRALEIDRRLGYKPGQAIRLSNIGISSIVIGRLAEAADYLDQSLSLHREIGSRPAEARILANLGEAVYEMGEFDRALAMLAEALIKQRRNDDRHTEADTLRVMASLYHDRGEAERALELARHSLEIAEEVGEERVRAYALLTLGRLIHGIDECRQALALAIQIDERLITAEAKVALAQAYLHAGNPRQAREHAQSALDSAILHGYRLVEADALATLGEVALATGLNTIAIGYLHRAGDLNEEMGRAHRAASCRSLSDPDWPARTT